MSRSGTNDRCLLATVTICLFAAQFEPVSRHRSILPRNNHEGRELPDVSGRGEVSMKSFKLVLLASAMTAGLAVAAHAADVTPPEPETTTPDQYQAMGFYLRGDLGWSFLDWGDDDNAFAV